MRKSFYITDYTLWYTEKIEYCLTVHKLYTNHTLWYIQKIEYWLTVHELYTNHTLWYMSYIHLQYIMLHSKNRILLNYTWSIQLTIQSRSTQHPLKTVSNFRYKILFSILIFLTYNLLKMIHVCATLEKWKRQERLRARLTIYLKS